MENILEGDVGNKVTKSGAIVITSEDVLKSDVPVILFKHHTDTDDFKAVMNAAGVVTIVGGSLSHASVVAREFDKACLIDCQELVINPIKNGITIKNKFYPAGTEVVVDGMTGTVYLK